MVRTQVFRNFRLKLRPPKQVMGLSRMGASHQTRLSFIRSLIRRMARENWRFEQLRFDVDKNRYGVSVYAAHAPKHGAVRRMRTRLSLPTGRTIYAAQSCCHSFSAASRFDL